MWLIVLSDQLPVEALVGRYPTNKLIGREPIPKHEGICSKSHVVLRDHPVLIQVSLGYPGLRGRLLTCYSPVRRSVIGLVTLTYSSLDLHALGTPPAFVLSQDQTLQRTFVRNPSLDPISPVIFEFAICGRGARRRPATWVRASLPGCSCECTSIGVEVPLCCFLARYLVVKEPTPPRGRPNRVRPYLANLDGTDLRGAFEVPSALALGRHIGMTYLCAAEADIEL